MLATSRFDRQEFPASAARGVDEATLPGMEYWRRTGRYVWWVNGQEVLRWGGKGRAGDMPKGPAVELHKGKNHFLAKVTNNRHAYGFAFSVEGLHPALRHEPRVLPEPRTHRPYS